MLLEQRKRTLYYDPPPPPMVLGTRENDILSYFWDQANNETRIPCEGIITDLPKSIYLFSIGIVCSFHPTFRANVETCSLGELQYQRDMFSSDVFRYMIYMYSLSKLTLD